jgi:hypothetical protein
VTTIEEAVVAKMVADEDIGDLVDTRIYPLLIPQTAALPAIAYQKVSSAKFLAQDGNSHLARSRIQLTLVAETYEDVKELADAVRACWQGYAGTVNYFEIQGAEIDAESDSENEGRSLQAASLTVQPIVRMDVALWHWE